LRCIERFEPDLWNSNRVREKSNETVIAISNALYVLPHIRQLPSQGLLSHRKTNHEGHEEKKDLCVLRDLGGSKIQHLPGAFTVIANFAAVKCAHFN
jgi:hypothetical protein